MSYDILYKRQFIRLQQSGGKVDLFLPMVEHGESNVWYAGNRGRAKNWKRLSCFDAQKPFLNASEIMQTIENWRSREIENDVNRPLTEKYEDQYFSYFSGITLYGRGKNTTSFGSIRNFFQKGIGQALTIEELQDFNVSLSLQCSLPGLSGKIKILSTEHLKNSVEKRLELAKSVNEIKFDLDISDFRCQEIKAHFFRQSRDINDLCAA